MVAAEMAGVQMLLDGLFDRLLSESRRFCERSPPADRNSPYWRELGGIVPRRRPTRTTTGTHDMNAHQRATRNPADACTVAESSSLHIIADAQSLLRRVSAADSDALETAIAAVMARQLRGVVISSQRAGYQRALQAALRVRERLSSALVGVYCPDLRAQDLLCRLRPEISLAWLDLPEHVDGIAELAATLRATRAEYPWKGQLCGDFGSLPNTVDGARRIVSAKDAGQFDMLALHAGHTRAAHQEYAPSDFADAVPPLTPLFVARIRGSADTAPTIWALTADASREHRGGRQPTRHDAAEAGGR